MKYLITTTIIIISLILNELNAQIKIKTNKVMFYEYDYNECKFNLSNTNNKHNVFEIYKYQLIVTHKNKTYQYQIAKDYLKQYIDKNVWYTENNEKLIHYIKENAIVLYYDFDDYYQIYRSYIIFY